jgi:hypothetical protein
MIRLGLLETPSPFWAVGAQYTLTAAAAAAAAAAAVTPEYRRGVNTRRCGVRWRV